MNEYYDDFHHCYSGFRGRASTFFSGRFGEHPCAVANHLIFSTGGIAGAPAIKRGDFHGAAFRFD